MQGDSFNSELCALRACDTVPKLLLAQVVESNENPKAEAPKPLSPCLVVVSSIHWRSKCVNSAWNWFPMSGCSTYIQMYGALGLGLSNVSRKYKIRWLVCVSALNALAAACLHGKCVGYTKCCVAQSTLPYCTLPWKLR